MRSSETFYWAVSATLIEGSTKLRTQRSDYLGQGVGEWGWGDWKQTFFRGTSELSPEREVHLAKKRPELQVERTAGAQVPRHETAQCIHPFQVAGGQVREAEKMLGSFRK